MAGMRGSKGREGDLVEAKSAGGHFGPMVYFNHVTNEREDKISLPG